MKKIDTLLANTNWDKWNVTFKNVNIITPQRLRKHLPISLIDLTALALCTFNDKFVKVIHYVC